ncbi:MAG: glycosyltransferase family 4 protein [Gammaproteobacteria bacterium]|nr:glycosyltransferase family 4 protein [Gammaproteobacteria bacterium]
MLDLVKSLDSTQFQSFIGAQPKSYLYRNQARLGVKIEAVSMRNALDVIGIFKIVRIIQKNGINLVVTYSGKDGWLGLIAARLCGKKVIRMKNLALFKHKTSYNLSDMVIVPSAYIKDFLTDRGVKEEKIRIVYPGIEPEKFRFRESDRNEIRTQYGVLEDEVLLIYVAFFRGPKAQDKLLEGMSRLHNPKVKLMLVGAGDDFQRIQEMIAAYKMEDRIILTGKQQNTARFLCAGDIFVFPSRTESFGKSVIEAMACGLPVVANDIPPVREILENGQRGSIYKYDDAKDMAAKLNHCLENRETCKTMADRNVRYVEEKFTLKRMTEVFAAIFQEAV